MQDSKMASIVFSWQGAANLAIVLLALLAADHLDLDRSWDLIIGVIGTVGPQLARRIF